MVTKVKAGGHRGYETSGSGPGTAREHAYLYETSGQIVSLVEMPETLILPILSAYPAKSGVQAV